MAEQVTDATFESLVLKSDLPVLRLRRAIVDFCLVRALAAQWADHDELRQ